MELLTPNLGLVFWTTLIFLVVLFLLSKFAWRPILSALRDRENFIEESLLAAEKAKEEMAAMKSEHEKLLNEAKQERNKILKEAKETRDSIINESKDKAKEDANKIVEDARQEITNQKEAALAEVKSKVGRIAVDIAEKILKKELEQQKDQNHYIEGLVEEIKLN